MKYFTKELWAGWQTKDTEHWHSVSEANWKRYEKQLLRLRDRISHANLSFFADYKKYDLHDGRVALIKITDKRETRALEKKKWDAGCRISVPTIVEIHAVDAYMRFAYFLKYDRVRRILYDFPSDSPLFYSPGEGMGDWGYHELSAVDATYLRHEILFASGTILSIEFKGFSFKRRRLSGLK